MAKCTCGQKGGDALPAVIDNRYRFKDAMPVSVRIVYILHFNHILAVKPTPIYMRNCLI